MPSDTMQTATTTRRQLLGGAIALGGMAALAATTEATAQETSKTYVLVHGSWHGGWCWQRVSAPLESAGHKVYTPTLTGLGDRSHLMSGLIDLDTHITDIVKLLHYEDLSDVVLVGHSSAGWVISGVAEQAAERIASTVFLDAFLPSDGQRLLDYSQVSDVEEQTKLRDMGIISRPAIPSSVFGIAEADQAWVDARLTPQPLGLSFTRLTLTGAREQIARKTYIRAPLYNNPAFDDALATCEADPSWQTFSILTGHDVMLTAPDDLVSILLDA